jgi:hypothetical protein
VELLRKVEKNDGQEDCVKLLPREVSKGEGSGVVTTVMEGDIEVDTTVGERFVSVSVAIAGAEVVSTPADVDGADVMDDVDDVSDSETVMGTTSSCRFCMYVVSPRPGTSRLEGGSERSMWISPLASSSLKNDDSWTRASICMSYADEGASIDMSIITKMSSIGDDLVEARDLRRLAGRRLFAVAVGKDIMLDC